MTNAVLLFDIGNTNIKIGITQRELLATTYVLPTDPHQTCDSIGFRILDILSHLGLGIDAIDACVGSSVVPDMNPIVRAAVKRYVKQPLLLAPEDISIPLENHYERPEQVGADRLVGAYAARKLYPEARSIVSVDFGTATTFDCVQDNAYLGGLICPGVKSAASALASNTAKLPQISLEVQSNMPVFGRSTSTSINHGFIFGFASMTEGLCKRLADTLEGPMQVVATGGFAKDIARVTPCFDHVRPDLLMEGLRILYLENR
ncbi:MAG: type III pantothenate kinase [Desulfovibrionales bacterium]|nr:type III pantothenate kinase [Desulfovibrionales bacterium]